MRSVAKGTAKSMWSTAGLKVWMAGTVLSVASLSIPWYCRAQQSLLYDGKIGHQEIQNNPPTAGMQVFEALAGIDYLYLDSVGGEYATGYFVDFGFDRVLYNKDANTVDAFGEFGSGEGQFRYAYGVAGTANGFVYVADTYNHRVVKLFNDGSNLTYVSSFGSQGSGIGQFKYPYDVAILQQYDDYKVYVLDTGNCRVQVFDSSDNYQYKFGSRGSDLGRFSEPRGIVTDGYYVYVADTGNQRIQRLHIFGDYPVAISASEMGLGYTYFCHAALDYFGSVYVTDSYNHQIHKFASDLSYLTSVGSEGDGTYQFQSPHGIAVLPSAGNLLVSEQPGIRGYAIGIEIVALGVDAVLGRSIVFSYTLSDAASCTTGVYQGSSVIRVLDDGSYYRWPGNHVLTWDGRDDQGTWAGYGSYSIKMAAASAYVSQGGEPRNVHRRTVDFQLTAPSTQIPHQQGWPQEKIRGQVLQCHISAPNSLSLCTFPLSDRWDSGPEAHIWQHT